MSIKVFSFLLVVGLIVYIGSFLYVLHRDLQNNKQQTETQIDRPRLTLDLPRGIRLELEKVNGHVFTSLILSEGYSYILTEKDFVGYKMIDEAKSCMTRINEIFDFQ